MGDNIYILPTDNVYKTINIDKIGKVRHALKHTIRNQNFKIQYTVNYKKKYIYKLQKM